MSEQEIKNAVEAARAQGNEFIFVPPNASPELREALANLAAETGREVICQTSAPAILPVDGDVPEIARNDKRAFLKNLGKIARGEVRVK